MKTITDFISSYKNIEFLNPDALYLLLVLVPVVALLFASYRRDKSLLTLLRAGSGKLLRQYALLCVAFLLMVSGTIGMLAQPVAQKYESSDINIRGEYIFLIDTSRSTEARADPDSKSQLELSKDIIMRLMNTFEGSRVQVFAYTSAAFALSDFTTNIKHIEETLDNLIYADVISNSGSDLPNALAVIARKKMNDERYSNVENVILFSDGQIGRRDAENLETATDMLRDNNITLTTIGVGSVMGWKIPKFDPDTGEFSGEYEQLRGENDFVSVLNERNLQIIAGLSGGEYFFYKDMEGIREYFIEKTEDSSAEVYVGERELLDSKDIGWMLIPLIATGLAILIFRKKLI